MSCSETHSILIVDDLPDNLLLLQTLLEVEGYQVEVADAGKSALEKIKSSPPDLLLLDVMMPELDGYELTEMIRQDDDIPYFPILLVTAHSDASKQQGMELGANDFIYKPIVDFDGLLSKVEDLLG